MMKHWLTIFIAIFIIFLTGCTTTIKSDVTTFHEWPENFRDKSFVSERTPEQENNLEYRSYENLVRNELQRLGFIPAVNSTAAALKVSIEYGVNVRDVYVTEPVVVDPFWYGPRWAGDGYYSPFYSPFWYGLPVVEQRERYYQLFRRQLKISIARMSDSRKLYDVTVNNEGSNGALAKIMPYMIRSAFADFPGKSGMSRRIELKKE